MSKETIGHKPTDTANMPELRRDIIEARFIPRLNQADSMLNQATYGKVDFIASILA